MTADAVVDTLCNAFTPDRRAGWEASIAAAGLSVKIRDEGDDDFAAPDAMVRRMDDLNLATLVIPTGDGATLAPEEPPGFEHLAARWPEVQALVEQHPGRFAALALVDPTLGMRGVHELREHLTRPWVVGCYVHTHSFDRPLDAAEYYPIYALCAEIDVPVAMQTGVSGGLLPSECGRPMTVDRAALYFPDTRFVLSHTGWPWVEEAVALALKFPNVFIGTGAYPPRHWAEPLRRFLTGPGRDKVVFATNFPTVGHRHALDQVEELELAAPTRRALLGGTARRVFTRLEGLEKGDTS
jgi:uncharacterized protein